MNSRWKTYLLYASLIIIGGIFLYLLIETIRLKNTGFETKSLWDWMELFIIPLVLAIGAYFLNRSERKTEREIAKDRQQEEALQAYISRMSKLLIEENLQTTKKKSVRDVAKTWTTTVMRILDAKRNNIVLSFLSEANLMTKSNSILKGAKLEGIDLHGLILVEMNFQDVKLGDSNLQSTVLGRSNLQNTNLDNANLQGAWFVKTNLKQVGFENSILKGAQLSSTDMQSAFLVNADLQGADLENTNLQNAVFEDANLRGANLENANLLGADFENANLQNVNLKGSIVTAEQLEAAKSLKGATMPDGTIHE